MQCSKMQGDDVNEEGDLYARAGLPSFSTTTLAGSM